MLVVGLAPAAHGANRTGRMFTGDRSGDFLFAAMHRTGFASQATSTARDDGLTLTDIRVTAPVRCAPPGNAPTPQERRTCGPFLGRELSLVRPRVVVVLGGFGWQALLTTLAEQGWAVPRPRPAFGHGVELVLAGPDGAELVLLGCFHVSQQNTFTGRLTPACSTRSSCVRGRCSTPDVTLFVGLRKSRLSLLGDRRRWRGRPRLRGRHDVGLDRCAGDVGRSGAPSGPWTSWSSGSASTGPRSPSAPCRTPRSRPGIQFRDRPDGHRRRGAVGGPGRPRPVA